MKRFAIVASLTLLAACSSSDVAPESAAAEPDARAAQLSQIRAQIQAKRTEIGQTDQDLAKIQAERRDLADQPASQQKTDRLVELARADSDAKQKKSSLTEDVADLQKQLGESAPPAPSAKPSKADDDLDAILAAADGAKIKEKEEAARREAEARKRKMAEEAAASESGRLAQAEARLKAEEEARAKDKIQGGRPAAGPDGAGFEERWADVLLQVRTELQRYKRW